MPFIEIDPPYQENIPAAFRQADLPLEGVVLIAVIDCILEPR